MTRDPQSPATENRKTRPTFVGAEIRLSRDGRHVLHFLAGGAVVRRSVEAYREALAEAGFGVALERRLAARWLAYLPTMLRLVLLALALGKAVSGGGFPSGLTDVARVLTDLIAEISD